MLFLEKRRSPPGANQKTLTSSGARCCNARPRRQKFFASFFQKRRPFFLVFLSLVYVPCLAETPPSVRIDGAVLHPQVFTEADLKAFAPVQVDVSVGTMHGQDRHVWTGALLAAVLQKVGLKNDSGKNSWLRHTLLARGADGYEVSLAIGEIDPMAENKQVIVAYRRSGDTGDLPGLRLVVPGDSHAPRQVHDLVEIEVR